MTYQVSNTTPIEDARAAINRAKALGYSHALLCLTAIEKDHIIKHDLLADIRAEGFEIHPGTTPDYPKQQAGDDRCEIIMIAWERPAPPDWLLPRKKAPAKAKRPARKATTKLAETGDAKAAGKTDKKPASKPAKKPTGKKAAKPKRPAKSKPEA